MSHAQVRNEALYQDRTVQDWHRDAFPIHHKAIDLDLFGWCPVSECNAPLYLIESSTNRDKPVSVIRALSRAASVVGLLVIHNRVEPIEARIVAPTQGDWHDVSWLVAYLRHLRREHQQRFHPNCPGSAD